MSDLTMGEISEIMNSTEHMDGVSDAFCKTVSRILDEPEISERVEILRRIAESGRDMAADLPLGQGHILDTFLHMINEIELLKAAIAHANTKT